MKSWRFALLAILITAAMVGVGWGVGRWRRGGAENAAVAPGKRGPLLYQVHCASCHGDEGHGDGSGAAHLHPPPRDFAERPWRFEPTAASIRRVTCDGIPGAAMPGFASALSPEELDEVAAHVLELATRYPVIDTPDTREQRLLKDAGFVDLRGVEPPPLQVSDAAGETITLAQMSGKVTLVHFWGTGCVHCLAEMPALVELQKRHAGRVAVLHVCVDGDDAAAAQKVLDQHVPGVRAYCDANGLGLARFEVQALPTVWLLSADGKAIARATGAKDWNSPPLKSLISQFLPPAE